MAVITTITTDLITEITGHMMAASTVGDITAGTTSMEADLGMVDFMAGEDFTAEAGAADDGGGHSQSKNHKNMKNGPVQFFHPRCGPLFP
jgi:hypothetical protein